MAQMKITILGCGSSGGVPRLGGHWGACDPANPKNARRRCSILVERITDAGTTSVLIDTSPDMRSQLLDAGVQRLPVWADTPTRDALLDRFGYVFIQPSGSSYPPILEMNHIDGDVTIDGPGGPLTFTPFLVNHGGMDALGFRVNDVAYLPDVAQIPDDIWPHLRDLLCWIVDALRRAPHPTHSHLAQTLEWIAQMAPQTAVLTNMHNDLDYDTLAAETPDHIEPAFDGMTLSFPV